MSDHNDMLGRTFFNCLLQELQAFLVLQIEAIRREASAIIHYLAEIIHASLNEIHIWLWYFGPQGSKDKVRIVYAHHLIIIIAHILTKHPLPTITSCSYIAITIKFMIARH